MQDGGVGGGNGIHSVQLNDDYTLTLTFDDGTSYTTPSIRGATGIAGANGTNGKDGTSVTHSWNGTALTITSASGTSSANLKGETGATGAKGDKGDKGDTGAQGPQGEQGIQGPKGDKGETGAQGPKGDKGDTGVTGPQGPKGDTGATGPKGADGKTPVKGTDYWTAADQESIVQQVITALGTPVFGRVDADNTITLNGALADGTYNIVYENGAGDVTEIGTFNHNYIPEPTYTNLLVPSACTINKRTNSSGVIADGVGVFVTDYIYIGDVMANGGTNVLHYKGLYFRSDNWVNGTYDVYTYICYFRGDKTFITGSNENYRISDDILTAEGDYVKSLNANYTDAKYIRVTATIVPNPSAKTAVTALESVSQLVNCKLALNETITD